MWNCWIETINKNLMYTVYGCNATLRNNGKMHQLIFLLRKWIMKFSPSAISTLWMLLNPRQKFFNSCVYPRQILTCTAITSTDNADHGCLWVFFTNPHPQWTPWITMASILKNNQKLNQGIYLSMAFNLPFNKCMVYISVSHQRVREPIGITIEFPGTLLNL